MSEQVAIGLALGGFSAMAQLALLRWRMQLLEAGRVRVAWTAFVLAYALVVVALAGSATVAPVVACASLVGLLGARTLVFDEVAPSTP